MNIIVATDENGLIGAINSLIWHLPNDLKYFKNKTKGCKVVMGRKTYESIGRPLPDRENIILTKDENFRASGCKIVNSIGDALLLCGDTGDSFVIGGGEIYMQFIDICDRIYLTLVHTELEGDTYFPDLEDKWYKHSEVFNEKDDLNEYDHTFIEYRRVI